MLVLLELAHVDPQCGYVEECHAYLHLTLDGCPLVGQHILRLISLII